MKAKVTAKQTTKTAPKADAKQTVKVPASVQSTVNAVKVAMANRQQATDKEQKSWVVCADDLKAKYKSRDDAAPVLKAAFEVAGMTEMMHGSYRSNILTLAFPDNEEEMKQGKADGLSTHQLVAVGRGSLKKSKKKDGGWIKVKRAEKRGAHNKIKPADKLDKDIALIATHVQTAKLDEDQVAVSIATHFADIKGFDPETFVSALQDQFGLE